jgi:GNAT superfamily N-acetyltransferase
MQSKDLAFADSVRAAVGWNQTIKDWERILSVQPDGCFVAEWDGKLAGTATTTCYGKQLSWIGMILVHPDFRRHGIGKALMNHCLKFLKDQQLECIKLDATPLGKTLYDKLGFKDEWNLARWEKETPQPERFDSKSIRALTASDWPKLLELDAKAFGVSRENLIRKLAEQSERVLVYENASGLAGYGMLRKGSRSNYLGPIISADEGAAQSLVRMILASANGSIFWDIPDQNEKAVELAKKFGFKQQRPLIRMYLGENRYPGEPKMQYAIADPATG